MDSYKYRKLLQRYQYLGVLFVVFAFASFAAACGSNGSEIDDGVTGAAVADAENDSTESDSTVVPDGLVAGWADCTAGEYGGSFFDGQGGYEATITLTSTSCEMLVRWTLEMSGYETRACVKPPNDGMAAPEYNTTTGLDLDLDAVCKIIRVEQASRLFEDEEDANPPNSICSQIVNDYAGKNLVVDLVAAQTNSALVNDGINAIGCCTDSRVSFRLGSDSGVGYDVISEREVGENEGCNQTVEYFNGGETPERVVTCEFAYLSYASARPGTVIFAESFETLPRYEELSECELVDE